jgi:hypothetical protein
LAVAVKFSASEVMAAPVPVVFNAAGAPAPVAANLNWSAAAKRPAAVKAFCKVTLGAMPTFVNVQTICAAGKTLAAGMANNCPVKVPNVPELPDTAPFVSVQLAPDSVK